MIGHGQDQALNLGAAQALRICIPDEQILRTRVPASGTWIIDREKANDGGPIWKSGGIKGKGKP